MVWLYAERALFLPWRADPLAVAAVLPLLYLRRAVARGERFRPELLTLWNESTETLAGPIAAAKQAFSIAGLSGSLTKCTAQCGQCIDLLEASCHSVTAFVLRAFRLTELSALASRRKPNRW